MTKIDGKRQKMYGKMREPSSPIKIEESFPADLSSKRSLFSYFHKQPKLLYEPFELSMADENNACLSAYEPRSSSPRTTEPPMLQQLYLDLGQKNFGMTTCSECHMVYNPSFKEDVRLHQKYHGQHGHGLLFDVKVLSPTWTFMGSKNERIYSLHVREATERQMKQIQQLLSKLEEDLGSVPFSLARLASAQIYLYMYEKHIVGACIVEPRPSWVSVVEPNSLFVARIWTREDWRRKRVASRLLEAARQPSLGVIIPKTNIFYSSPTHMGLEFAKSYQKGPPNTYQEEERL